MQKEEKITEQNFVFFLSGKCNLKCDYCNLNKEDEEMKNAKNDLEKLEKALKKREELYPDLKIKKILLSGGEPTLFEQSIVTILEKYQDIYDFYIITNGTKLDVIKRLMKYKVDFLVSYDGHENGRGYDAFNTIKYLYENDRLTQISMVVGNGNYHKLYDTLKEIKDCFPRMFEDKKPEDAYYKLEVNIARCKSSYYKMDYKILEEQFKLVYNNISKKLSLFNNRGNGLCKNFLQFEEDILCTHTEGKLITGGCFNRVDNLDYVLNVYEKHCKPCKFKSCYFKTCPINIEFFEINEAEGHPICKMQEIIHNMKQYDENKQIFTDHISRIDEVEMILTDSCNLACKYCFQKGLHSNHVTSKETVDKIFSEIIDLPSDHITNKTLNLFGGEPILPTTLDIRNYILEYLKSDKYKGKINIAVTSNTYSFTEKDEEWLREIKKYAHYVFWQVSVDSVEEINDQQRVTRNNKGTFKQVIENMKKVSEILGKEFVSINSVITTDNILGLTDWCKYISDNLYDKYTRRITFRVDQSREAELTLREQLYYTRSYLALVEAYNQGLIHHAVVKSAFNVKRFMYDENLTKEKDEFSSCGMCNNFVTINYDGEIIPCHTFVNNKVDNLKYSIGNILTGEISDDIEEIFKLLGTNYQQYSDYAGINCYECEYKMECVRCKADQFIVSGDIKRALNHTCELTRLRGNIYRKNGLYEKFKPLKEEEKLELIKDVNDISEILKVNPNQELIDMVNAIGKMLEEKKWYI